MFSTSLLDTDKIRFLTRWIHVVQCKPMNFIYIYLAGVMVRVSIRETHCDLYTTWKESYCVGVIGLPVVASVG